MFSVVVFVAQLKKSFEPPLLSQQNVMDGLVSCAQALEELTLDTPDAAEVNRTILSAQLLNMTNNLKTLKLIFKQSIHCWNIGAGC